MAHKTLAAATGLLMMIGLSQAIIASYAIPEGNIGTGVVQEVNEATHSVTVAGHVYGISSKAVYMSEGGGEVRGLKPGMRIRFIADGPVKKPGSKIVNVIVLPSAPQ